MIISKGFGSGDPCDGGSFQYDRLFQRKQQDRLGYDPGLIQTLLVRLPLAYFMSIQPNASLTKIGLAAPISTIVGIILNVGFFLYLEKKERNKRRGIPE